MTEMNYDYTVEVTNRFKGLELIEHLKNYGQRFVTCTGGGDQNHPKRKRNAKRQYGCLRRLTNSKVKKQKAKEKRKDVPN